MKKVIIFLTLIYSLSIYSQSASKVNNAQNITVINNNPDVLLSCDSPLSGLFRVNKKDSIKWNIYNIIGLEDFINLKGDARFKNITYTPSNIEIIMSLGFNPYPSSNPNGYINSYTEIDNTVPNYSKSLTSFNIIKVSTDLLYEPIFIKNTAFNKNYGTGAGTTVEGNDPRVLNGQIAFDSLTNYLLNSVAISTYQPIGNYLTPSSVNTLTNKTGNISQWTNNIGYLTSITSGQVTTALGFNPYDSTNPNNYINLTQAKAGISLTTTSTGNGLATYNNSTGVFNIPRRFETFQVTTGAAGTASVVYNTTFTIPNVQFNIVGGDVKDTIRLTVNNTTGCTVIVQRRVDVLGILPSYNNVNGAVVNILVTEN